MGMIKLTIRIPMKQPVDSTDCGTLPPPFVASEGKVGKICQLHPGLHEAIIRSCGGRRGRAWGMVGCGADNGPMGCDTHLIVEDPDIFLQFGLYEILRYRNCEGA